MNSNIHAIDVHGHFGQYDHQHTDPHVCRFMSASADEVHQRALACGIGTTIVSPLRGLLPRFHGRAYEGNIDTQQAVDVHPGLRQWVIIDPRDARTFDQAATMLAGPRCMGIKIHPEEHGYPIREYGDALFGFAAEHHAVVLTHSGEENSLPADFIPFADRYPQVVLILAHLGHGPEQDPTHQVRAIQQSRAGNVYTDTSSSASILPNLIEWAVQEIGCERLLFGTDTPLYYAANQKARIDFADITDDEKLSILSGNALRVIEKLQVTNASS